MDKLEEMVKGSLISQTVKLNSMQSQLNHLQTKSVQQEKVIDDLIKEVREKNICLHGLSDSSSESEIELKTAVHKIIADITTLKIVPDKIYRCGNFQIGQTRKIKVKFVTISERDLVYANKSKLKHPIYINADISPNESFAHKLLRDKKKELISQGIQSTIDYKTRSLKSDDGGITMEVKNGTLIRKVTKTKRVEENPEPSASTGSAESEGAKKSKPTEDTTNGPFLENGKQNSTSS